MGALSHPLLLPLELFIGLDGSLGEAVVVPPAGQRGTDVVLHCTTTSLYTDCSNNLYAGSPSYLLILFSALSAFAVVG